jgi:hypothetical protein
VILVARLDDASTGIECVTARKGRAMEIFLLTILAALALIIAAYAHKMIPLFTKRGSKVVITRAILILVGIGFGLTGMAYVQGAILQALVFLINFGIVHIPAAIVLFVKSRRGEPRS